MRVSEPRRLAPGLYEVTDGREVRLELDVPELLVYWGYRDTPPNREVVADEAARIFRERYPNTPVHTV